MQIGIGCGNSGSRIRPKEDIYLDLIKVSHVYPKKDNLLNPAVNSTFNFSGRFLIPLELL